MVNCDHTIAFGYDDFWDNPIRVSNKAEAKNRVTETVLNADGRVAYYTDRLKSIVYEGDEKKIYEEVLHLYTFNYCPDCGDKIEWEGAD